VSCNCGRCSSTSTAACRRSSTAGSRMSCSSGRCSSSLTAACQVMGVINLLLWTAEYQKKKTKINFSAMILPLYNYVGNSVTPIPGAPNVAVCQISHDTGLCQLWWLDCLVVWFVASDKDTWYTTMQRMWPQFMPMPLDDNDSHPCSFSAIFSDPFSASFYSLTWAEVGHHVW